MTPKKTILVVDDETVWLTLIRRILEDHTYKVITAESATDAMTELKKQKPDLILTDIRMPDVNGFDFVSNLRATPAFKSIPVIFLSGIDDFDAKRFARGLGAMEYIVKPVDEKDMLKTVAKHLGRRG